MNTQTQPIREQGLMIYPGDTSWRKALWRAPITIWRLGLSFMLPREFLLLTTRGRQSGLPRRAMLEYSYMDGRIYLSSGWGSKAQWYQNIIADPRVTVQTRDHGLISGTAERVLEDAKLEPLYWKLRHSPVWPEYLQAWGIGDRVDEILANKDRLIILRIEPGRVDAPPPQPADLAWVWFPVGALFVGYWVYSRLRKLCNG